MSYEPPPLEPELAQLESELRTLRPLAPRFRLSRNLSRALEHPAVLGRPLEATRFLGSPWEKVSGLPWRRFAPAAAAAAAIIVAGPAIAPQNEQGLSMAPAAERKQVAHGNTTPRVEMVFGGSVSPPPAPERDPRLKGAEGSQGWRSNDSLPDKIKVFIPEPSRASPFPEARSPYGFLGVGVHPLPAYVRAQLQHLDLGETTGLLVSEVGWNGPAHRAGVSLYDIIIALNGETVTSTEDFVQRVRKTPPGAEVELQIVRGGKRATIRLTLIPAPSA